MINVARENVFRLQQAPNHIPPGSNGKKVHVSTVFRWALSGVRGVRLETIRLGGALHSSAEAIQRFAEALSSADDSGAYVVKPDSTAASAAAAKALEAMGV